MNPSSQNKLLDWLEDQQNSADKMEVEVIPLEEVGEPWGINEGNYQRTDGKFFGFIGVWIKKAAREVMTGWKQGMLKEFGPKGVVAIVQEQTNGMVLVTAKQEPGNKSKGRILLAPSFQASSANMEQAHGGDKPPLAQIIDDAMTTILSQSDQPADGGRYFEKENDVRVLQVDSPCSIREHVKKNQRWATLNDIEQVALLGLCNTHLRDALLMLEYSKKGDE